MFELAWRLSGTREHRVQPRATFVCMNAIPNSLASRAAPGHCIKAARRDDDGVEEVGFVGYIAETTPAGKRLHVRAAGPCSSEGLPRSTTAHRPG